MRRSPADSQLNLPPTEVQKSEVDRGDFCQVEVAAPSARAFRNSEVDRRSFANTEHDDAIAVSYRESAMLFDEACKGAQLTNKEIAHLWACSESLVQKMRSPGAPGARVSPSFAQMLRLPPPFHIALHRRLNRKYGFIRQALQDILEAVGALALAVNE